MDLGVQVGAWRVFERELAELSGGVFGRLSGQDPEVDGEAVRMEVSDEIRARAAAEEEIRRVVPKRMYIRKGDLKQFGYSQGCLGCNSIIRGGTTTARA